MLTFVFADRLARANYMEERKAADMGEQTDKINNLSAAEAGREYIIKDIATDDEELNSFLFSLGCYSGEPIAIVRKLKGSVVVTIKDGRYNIDNELASAILV